MACTLLRRWSDVSHERSPLESCVFAAVPQKSVPCAIRLTSSVAKSLLHSPRREVMSFSIPFALKVQYLFSESGTNNSQFTLLSGKSTSMNNTTYNATNIIADSAQFSARSLSPFAQTLDGIDNVYLVTGTLLLSPGISPLRWSPSKTIFSFNSPPMWHSWSRRR